MSFFRITILACLAATATFSTPAISIPLVVGPVPSALGPYKTVSEEKMALQPMETPISAFDDMIPTPTSIPESPEIDMDLGLSSSPVPTWDIQLMPSPSEQPVNDPFMDTYPMYTPDASMPPMDDPYQMHTPDASMPPMEDPYQME